jgi:hypothetical protein
VSKGLKPVLIFVEIILIGWLISAVVKNGWPTGGLVLWLTIIIEVGLGYLAYRLYLSQIRAYTDPAKRKIFVVRGLLGFAVMLAGICGPIAIYYSGIEILKPAGTPFYFLLATNSLYLYATFRKFPREAPSGTSGIQTVTVYPPNLFSTVSRGDEFKAEHLALLSSRIFHCLALVSIPMAIIALTVILPFNGVIPPLASSYGIMTAIMLYIASGLVMLLYRWKGIRKWFLQLSLMPYQAPYVRAFMEHLFRIMWLEIVTVYGFLVGLLSGIWFGIPLFLLSGIPLVLTYPTATKWIKLMNEDSMDDSKS